MKSGHFVIDILIPKLITPIKFFNMVLGIEKYFQISNVTVQYLKILLFRLFFSILERGDYCRVDDICGFFERKRFLLNLLPLFQPHFFK